MKQLFVMIGIFLFLSTSKCQLTTIPILIGYGEETIMHYLDSLNHLKDNPAYKVDRSTDKYGDLVLKNEFSIVDEDYYKCIAVAFTFRRISGKEICTSQYFYGDIKNAFYNLNFVKDNFKKIDENKWERPLVSHPDLKIIAEYFKIDGSANVVGGTSDTYAIRYDMATNKSK